MLLYSFVLLLHIVIINIYVIIVIIQIYIIIIDINKKSWKASFCFVLEFLRT